MKTDLAGLELNELEDFVQSLGHKKFHAKQIYNWIWKRGVTDFAEMTNLSRELRAAFAEKATVSLPEVVQHQVSEDGTQKFVLRLADGKQIESVFIPDTPKQTFCVSTQVGCAMGCAFCLTGKMGLVRHLTASEIAGQVRLLARSLALARQIVQHRPDGDGRAAAQLRQHDEGDADAEREGRARHASKARDAFDRRPGPADGQARAGRVDAESCRVAPRGIRGAARGHRAAEQEVHDAGRDRCVQALPAVEAPPDHVRVRDACGHQRFG